VLQAGVNSRSTQISAINQNDEGGADWSAPQRLAHAATPLKWAKIPVRWEVVSSAEYTEGMTERHTTQIQNRQDTAMVVDTAWDKENGLTGHKT